MGAQGEKKFELMGIPPEKLGRQFEQIGERKFRAKQLMKWIYAHGNFDFSTMTDIPVSLRQYLAENASITLPEIAEVAGSSDGSTKFLFRLQDGAYVESVYIPDRERGRHTVCLSSQVGCKFGCVFCATGKMGFVRNLTSTEIVGQLYLVREHIRVGGNDLTNVVFMGMGEPLDNLDAVLDAIRVMVADVGFGLGLRKILISTVGIPEGIKKIMQTDVRPKLAISLNAPDDELRSKLMPVNKKYPIRTLVELVPEYAKYSRRWVTFEYVLFGGVNDSLEHAHKLVQLIAGLPAKVNLIPYNEVEGIEFRRPDDRDVLRFQSYLLANSIVATIRYSKGRDIHGACGQLAGRFVLKEK
ncbi:23S rRNA (adenine(2503)-C(2))-methyltransferase RlmN [bacterium]|nr:23S rRNA (adenine(2503)-C(2))-methyltransferase RlmN [bacterium]